MVQVTELPIRCSRQHAHIDSRLKLDCADCTWAFFSASLSGLVTPASLASACGHSHGIQKIVTVRTALFKKELFSHENDLLFFFSRHVEIPFACRTFNFRRRAARESPSPPILTPKFMTAIEMAWPEVTIVDAPQVDVWIVGAQVEKNRPPRSVMRLVGIAGGAVSKSSPW